MIYNIKTLNKSVINKKINDTDRVAHIVIPFIVESLGLSDNVVMLQSEFTIAKSKTIIKQKIKAELKRLAEHKEFTLEI